MVGKIIVFWLLIGILIDKRLLNKDNMNDVKYVKTITQKDFKKSNFLFNLFSSFREKMNQNIK